MGTSNKKALLSNTLSLYMMNIVKLIFPLLTLPYLTRILSTEIYGVVTYVKAVNVYIQLIIDFGFLLSATKEIVFASSDLKKIGRITGDTIAEKGILAICACVFFALAACFIPILKENLLFSSLYLISVLVTIFLFDFLFRGLEKMHLIAIPYIIAKTITTAFTFILIHNDSDVLLIPFLEIIGNLVAIIISFYFVKKLKIKITFSSYKKWLVDLKESTVYFISNFATTIFGALTTLIAGLFLSMTNIAYWGICMQILSAIKALYNPITNSLYPHMLRERDISFIKKIGYIMFIPMIFGSLILLLGADKVMQIIGGQKYIEAGLILKILLPAFVFSFYSLLYGWPVLGAIGKVKETTFTTVLTSIIQVFGLAILIIGNIFTLTNLAIVTSISEVVLFLSRFFVYYKNRNLFCVGGKK